MSDRGNGLAIIALILGIGGVGIGAYAIFFMPNIIVQQASGSSEITQMWTVEQSSTFYPGSSYSDMTDMDVTITVNAGETVYVMFNAQISNGPSDGNGFLTGGVRIMRDTVEVPGSERVFILQTTVGLSIGNSITTHFIIEALAAGTYELKVQATAQTDAGTDRVTDGLLMVYTYR